MAITRFKANGEMGYPDQATPERFNQLVDETNNEISNSLGDSAFNGGLLTLEQINSLTLKQGMYSISNSVATSILGSAQLYGYNVFVAQYNKSGFPTQMLCESAGTKQYFRSWNGTIWVLKQIATTDKIDISFPFDAGYTIAHDGWFANKIIKNDLKQGFIYCSVKRTEGIDFGSTLYKVGTLPSGFLSKYNCGGVFGMLSAPNGQPVNGSAQVQIGVANGSINVMPSTNCHSITFIMPYEIL